MDVMIKEKIELRYEAMDKEKLFDNAIGKEIANNSDRGIVLVCSSVIEASLEKLLKTYLVNTKNTDGDMFRTKGILSTFDAKIKTSFYLGLISVSERKNLEQLQKVRNKFAHQILITSFEDNDIKNLCSHFYIPKNGFLSNSPGLFKVDLNPIKKSTSTEERFLIIFEHLRKTLLKRTILAMSNTCKEPKEISADDAIMIEIDINKDMLDECERVISKLKNRYEELKLVSDPDEYGKKLIEEEKKHIKEKIDVYVKFFNDLLFIEVIQEQRLEAIKDSKE